jgi:peptidoglycan/xylan/chitin deacetylase (PgdA/CDA1 family)
MKNSAINICYYSRLHKAFSIQYGGHVSIALLHRVSSTPPDDKDPLSFLSVSENFLDSYIQKKKQEGWDFISMGELYTDFNRLTRSGKHMLITLDDGYKDNYTCGYPIFKRHQIPFTVYISNCFPDRKANLWWELLANIALPKNEINLIVDGINVKIKSSCRHKRYLLLCKYFMSLNEQGQKYFLDRLLYQYTDTQYVNNSELLSWDEIRDMAQDQLCTIGAHTISHRNLRSLNDQEAHDEIYLSKVELEQKIGSPVLHFAYPYGKTGQISERDVRLVREAGYLTAVTTNIGNVFPEHKNFLHLLPRFPLYEGKTLGKISEIYLTGMHGALTRRLHRVVTL